MPLQGDADPWSAGDALGDQAVSTAVAAWGATAGSRPLCILFVCSRNQWRSPTAEAVWRKDARLAVRSAGTSASAKKMLAAADIAWADRIFVMEDKHRAQILAKFGQIARHKRIVVLGIPDEYRFMDPELVADLKALVAAALRFSED
jgi:predicted protein tyrosine phosphatase